MNGLEENNPGFKTGVRNFSNPLYADDTILTAEHANNLQILLMKVKEHNGKNHIMIKEVQINDNRYSNHLRIDSEDMHRFSF